VHGNGPRKKHARVTGTCVFARGAYARYVIYRGLTGDLCRARDLWLFVSLSKRFVDVCARPYTLVTRSRSAANVKINKNPSYFIARRGESFFQIFYSRDPAVQIVFDKRWSIPNRLNVCETIVGGDRRRSHDFKQTVYYRRNFKIMSFAGANTKKTSPRGFSLTTHYLFETEKPRAKLISSYVYITFRVCYVAVFGFILKTYNLIEFFFFHKTVAICNYSNLRNDNAARYVRSYSMDGGRTQNRIRTDRSYRSTGWGRLPVVRARLDHVSRCRAMTFFGLFLWSLARLYSSGWRRQKKNRSVTF